MSHTSSSQAYTNFMLGIGQEQSGGFNFKRGYKPSIPSVDDVLLIAKHMDPFDIEVAAVNNPAWASMYFPHLNLKDGKKCNSPCKWYNVYPGVGTCVRSVKHGGKKFYKVCGDIYSDLMMHPEFAAYAALNSIDGNNAALHQLLMTQSRNDLISLYAKATGLKPKTAKQYVDALTVQEIINMLIAQNLSSGSVAAAVSGGAAPTAAAPSVPAVPAASTTASAAPVVPALPAPAPTTFDAAAFTAEFKGALADFQSTNAPDDLREQQVIRDILRWTTPEETQLVQDLMNRFCMDDGRTHEHKTREISIILSYRLFGSAVRQVLGQSIIDTVIGNIIDNVKVDPALNTPEQVINAIRAESTKIIESRVEGANGVFKAATGWIDVFIDRFVRVLDARCSDSKNQGQSKKAVGPTPTAVEAYMKSLFKQFENAVFMQLLMDVESALMYVKEKRRIKFSPNFQLTNLDATGCVTEATGAKVKLRYLRNIGTKDMCFEILGDVDDTTTLSPAEFSSAAKSSFELNRPDLLQALLREVTSQADRDAIVGAAQLLQLTNAEIYDILQYSSDKVLPVEIFTEVVTKNVTARDAAKTVYEDSIKLALPDETNNFLNLITMGVLVKDAEDLKSNEAVDLVKKGIENNLTIDAAVEYAKSELQKRAAAAATTAVPTLPAPAPAPAPTSSSSVSTLAVATSASPAPAPAPTAPITPSFNVPVLMTPPTAPPALPAPSPTTPTPAAAPALPAPSVASSGKFTFDQRDINCDDVWYDLTARRFKEGDKELFAKRKGGANYENLLKDCGDLSMRNAKPTTTASTALVGQGTGGGATPAELKKLEEDIKARTTELQQVNDKITENQQALTTLQSTIATTTTDKQQLEQAITKLKDDQVALDQAKTALEEEIKQLEDKLGVNDVSGTGLRAEVIKAQQKVDALKLELTTEQGKLADAQQQLKEAKDEYDQVKNATSITIQEAAAVRINELEAQVQEHLDTIKELRSELDVARRERDEAKSQLRDAQDKLKSESARLQGVIDQTSADLKDAVAKRDECLERERLAQGSQSTQVAELTRLQGEVTRLTNELAQATTQHKQALDGLRLTLKDNVDAAKLAQQGLQDKLTAIQATLQQKETENNNLLLDKTTSATEKANLEQEIQQLKSLETSYKEKVSKADTTIKALEDKSKKAEEATVEANQKLADATLQHQQESLNLHNELDIANSKLTMTEKNLKSATEEHANAEQALNQALANKQDDVNQLQLNLQNTSAALDKAKQEYLDQQEVVNALRAEIAEFEKVLTTISVALKLGNVLTGPAGVEQALRTLDGRNTQTQLLLNQVRNDLGRSEQQRDAATRTIDQYDLVLGYLANKTGRGQQLLQIKDSDLAGRPKELMNQVNVLLNEKDKQATELASTKQTLTEREGQLQQALTNLQQEQQKLQQLQQLAATDKSAAVQEAMNQAQVKVQEALNEVARLQGEVDGLKLTIEEYDKVLIAIARKLGYTPALPNKLNTQDRNLLNDYATKQLAELQTNENTSKQQAEEARQQIIQAQAKLATAELERDTASSNLSVAQQSLSALQQQAGVDKQTIDAAKAQVSEAQTKQQQAQDKVNELNRQIGEYVKVLQAVGTLLGVGQLQDIEPQVKLLKNKETELKDQLQTERRTFQEILQGLQNLRGNLLTGPPETQQAGVLPSVASVIIEDITDQYDNLEERRATITANIQKARRQLQAAKKKLNEVSVVRATRSGMKKASQDVIDAAKAKFEQAEKMLIELTKQEQELLALQQPLSEGAMRATAAVNAVASDAQKVAVAVKEVNKLRQLAQEPLLQLTYKPAEELSESLENLNKQLDNLAASTSELDSVRNILKVLAAKLEPAGKTFKVSKGRKQVEIPCTDAKFGTDNQGRPTLNGILIGTESKGWKSYVDNCYTKAGNTEATVDGDKIRLGDLDISNMYEEGGSLIVPHKFNGKVYSENSLQQAAPGLFAEVAPNVVSRKRKGPSEGEEEKESMQFGAAPVLTQQVQALPAPPQQAPTFQAQPFVIPTGQPTFQQLLPPQVAAAQASAPEAMQTTAVGVTTMTQPTVTPISRGGSRTFQYPVPKKPDSTKNIKSCDEVWFNPKDMADDDFKDKDYFYYNRTPLATKGATIALINPMEAGCGEGFAKAVETEGRERAVFKQLQQQVQAEKLQQGGARAARAGRRGQ